MKKLKELWKDNKIAIVLISILVICFLAICVVALTYFFEGEGDVYGNRLDGQENYPFESKDQDKFTDTLKENELVKEVNLYTQGRIIYIDITLEDAVTLVEGQTIASDSLKNLEEKLLDFYDISFTLIKGDNEETEEDDSFVIMGSRNVVSTIISWNNNTPIEEEPEEE